jgi:hypothetical protein
MQAEGNGAVVRRCGHGLIGEGAAGGVSRFVFPAPGQELGDEGADGGNEKPAFGNEMETGPLHMRIRQQRGGWIKSVSIDSESLVTLNRAPKGPVV